MKKTLTMGLLLPGCFAAVLIFLSSGSFAQQKPDEQAGKTKTITVHVTKVVDGDKVVIDTTIVTEEGFDADAFLKGKGVTDYTSEKGNNVERQIIIRHAEPGSDETITDTIIINNPIEIEVPDGAENGMQSPFIMYDNQGGCSHMQGPQIENMLEGIARSFGLENVMPFGEMKQVVVKKKRHGKKVIITFEDRDPSEVERIHKEKIIMMNGDATGDAAKNGNKVIVIEKAGEGTQVVNETDNQSGSKQQKKIVVITEEKTK